jgi:hypothetical protein
MRLWKTLVSNQTKYLFLCLLAILLPVCASCGPASSTPQTIISTATTQPSSTPPPTFTTTPSITPTATLTITPTATPTLAPTVEAPSFWTENQELFEQNGYNLVASSTGWEIQYKGNTVFTDKEAQNKSFTPISSDAGPTMVFTQFDEEGAVEKFYNPQVNPDFGEAEWEDYLDVSVDSLKPAEVTMDQVHSGQVLMSALIKNGTGQWWEDNTEPFRYAVAGQATVIGANREYKSTQILFGASTMDDINPGYQSTSRFLGFYETNFDSEKIVASMIQTLVSEDGKTVTLSAGYSGEILTKMWDAYTPYLQKVTFRTAGDELFRLYEGINDGLVLTRYPGLTTSPGAQKLYEQDPNNQPWKLFPQLLSQLEQPTREELLQPGTDFLIRELVDDSALQKLQFQVLYPIDMH